MARRHTRRLLELAGFRVLATGEPEAGLRLAKDCVDPLCLVVCDGSLTGLSGVELHREVRANHPGVKALFLCGGPALTPRVSGEDWATLSDPTTVRELNTRLRQFDFSMEPASSPP